MFSRESKILLTVTGLTHFTVHAVMVMYPAIIILLAREFDVDLATLGWIYGLSGFMFGLGAIPAGWLESRVGGRRLLLGCQIGMVLSCLALYFSRSLGQLTAALFFLGLSASIYHPAGLTLISRSTRQISRAMGYHGVAGNLGLALGPFLASLFAVGISWRTGYGLVALFSLALVGATAAFLPSSPSPRKESSSGSGEVTRVRPLAVYYSIVVLVGLTFYGFATFMPAHFTENLGGPFQDVDRIIRGGLFSTLVLLSGIGGQLAGGKLGDSFRRTLLLPLITLAHIPLLVFFGVERGAFLVLSGVLLGIVHFSFQPVGNSLVAEFTAPASRGMGYGVSFFLSFGIGAVGSGVGGNLATSYGVGMVFPFVAGWMALAFILSLFLKRLA
ncbi:MAG: MFS transporter [Fidelibacterota bacterium]